MSIKLIILYLISSLLLIGCGTNTQKEEIQIKNEPHQVELKPKTSRAFSDPESEEYLNYMKIYNLNSLSFRFQRVNKAWALNYRGNYKGKKAYYLDTDKNNQTGYYNKWAPKVGADYLLEEGVLFKYTGTDGSKEWSWKIVSYHGMRDFDHSIKSILAYGITLNDDWSYGTFLGYYDTDFTYKEINAKLIKDEGKSNKHGAFYIAEDSEDFYIRALNYNYMQKEKAKYYNYEFTINGTNYEVESNILFNASGKEMDTNLLHELHKRYSIVVIPKTLLVSGDIKLEKAVIKDANWNTLNSYKYEENYSYKITKEELIEMIEMEEDYSQVDVSGITDMSYLFEHKKVKYDITGWNVSNVTNMNMMFAGAEAFNQLIGDWDVSNVVNMEEMFAGASSFNQPIGDWNVSNVTSMNNMFYGASSFNQPIGDWNISNVIDMNMIFYWATAFNQPIGDWDVSNVPNMRYMFYEAISFNQPIRDWDVSNVVNMDGMFAGADLFNQPIGDWDVSNVTDMQRMFAEASSFNQPIEDWDVSNVTNMGGIFRDAKSFNQPIGGWDVSNVTSMSMMFSDAWKFNQPIGDWDVSKVYSMFRMFSGTSSFNQPIGNWNVSNVTSMYGMFYLSRKFNQPIGDWDVSNVINMDSMFEYAEAFNQSIANWNVVKVKDFNRFNKGSALEYANIPKKFR